VIAIKCDSNESNSAGVLYPIQHWCTFLIDLSTRRFMCCPCRPTASQLSSTQNFFKCRGKKAPREIVTFKPLFRIVQMRDMYKLSGKSIHVLRNLAGLKSACECVYDGTVYPNLDHTNTIFSYRSSCTRRDEPSQTLRIRRLRPALTNC
jgi:hypothetical protein